MGKKKTELRDCEERAARAEYALKTLSDRIEDTYVTPDEFVDKFAVMLKEYLERNYYKEKSHPHDLATATYSFIEAYWIISDHRGI